MLNNILNSLQNLISKNSISLAPKNDAYDKKISHLKHKIIFNICICGALLVIIMSIIFYSQYLVTGNNEDVRNLNAQIEALRNKSANIEARVNDAKKYKQIWIESAEKKKNFDGIKISDLNDSFKNLAEKNNLSGAVINISVPEVLKEGVYNRQALDVYLVNFVLTFDALTDKIAVDFISSFLNSLPGYVVINDLSIKKNKKEGYSDEDLINISSGKINGLIAVKVNFSWYFLKRKTIK
ncbi:MAG: hypothetical protein V4612_01815 [Pseudomonadota bacterium]